MEENESVTKKGKSFYFIDALMIRIFFVALIIFAVLALIPALRPDYSEAEKRPLKKFPDFSFSSLISGSYFDDINLWYADTFPLRDKLIDLNGVFKGRLKAGDTFEIHGDLTVGDGIPESDNADSPENSSTASQDSTLQDGVASKNTDSQSAPTVPAVPTYENLGAILRVQDTAFEYYNFNQRIADLYVSHISYAADILKGTANVYAVIAPTSMGITLPDDMYGKINSTDQKSAIEYMYNKMSSNVNKVNAFGKLKSHNKEYIYFRTDHHWTALGAYYAYCAFADSKGKTPPSLENFIKHEFPGYLGSFYRQTKSPYLANNPDTVVAFEPTWTNTITTVLGVGNVVDKKIVSDGNALGQGDKYLCFISGDRPYGVINNPAIAEGPSCLVVKDSYGNAIVPFFVADYKTVHVIDYRHFSQIDARKLDHFVIDNGITDVIFINNISSTRNEGLVNQIGQFIR